MSFNSCIKCRSSEYTVKSTILNTKSNDFKIFNASNELFYIKICSNCGYSELYNAKLVDKNVSKNLKGV